MPIHYYQKTQWGCRTGNNKLTSLPPQIATSLPQLRELNVSLNELPFLPAEINGLRLESLSVAGNPWIYPPEKTENNGNGATRPASSNPQPHRFKKPLHTGTTTRHFNVAPLTELCMRVLMSPAVPTLHTTCLAHREHIPIGERQTTTLETKYEVPLVKNDFPTLIVDTVHACIPRSITDQRKEDWRTAVQASPAKKARTGPSPYFDDDPFVDTLFPPRGSSHKSRTRTQSSTSVFSTHSRASTRIAIEPPKPAHPGISICPSPLHLNQTGKPVYIRHAVERFTWEDEIAGMKMGETGGVPVLWRGCGPYCLDWLDEDEPDGQGELAENDEGPEVGQSVQIGEEADQEVAFRAPDLSGGLADAFYESDG